MLKREGGLGHGYGKYFYKRITGKKDGTMASSKGLFGRGER